MFVRWNFTVCWVTQSSFAISSFDLPLASSVRIATSRSVSPAALAPLEVEVYVAPTGEKTVPPITWRSGEGRSLGSTVLST